MNRRQFSKSLKNLTASSNVVGLLLVSMLQIIAQNSWSVKYKLYFRLTFSEKIHLMRYVVNCKRILGCEAVRVLVFVGDNQRKLSNWHTHVVPTLPNEPFQTQIAVVNSAASRANLSSYL